MKTKTIFKVLNTAVFTILCAMWFFGSAAAGDTMTDYLQIPVILNAKDVLPKDILQGENYQIDYIVKNDGFINTYQLDTDYGPLEVESTAELMIRINELRALKGMEEVERSEVFGEAIKKGITAPFKGAAQMVRSPIQTTKGIIKGTGRFFSNVGRSIVSDDPHQDNVLKVALGYDAAKRAFAYEFAIDPYSSYDPAMSRLGQIARTAVAGGLAPRVAMAAVDHSIATGMSISSTAKSMRKLVRDNPPGELRKINRKKLEGMGIEPSLVKAFLDNYSYSPQERTMLVGELETMHGVESRDMFIIMATGATEESVALFFRLTAQMIAGYNAKVAPAARILNINGEAILQGKDGALIWLAPLDYVFLTEGVDYEQKVLDGAIRTMPGVTGKELWINGRIDPAASKFFLANGWKVTPNAGDILIK